MLEFPGIVVPIFRQVHTHIVGSTRKTFMEQTLPAELRGRPDLVQVRSSGGFDLVRFKWNDSEVHFVGLDKPGKWFSTEIGACAIDEAQEVSVEHVRIINSRLRQRCERCIAIGEPDCFHMPHRMILTFNPSYPGHWLEEWFILGATRTKYGFRKEQLVIAGDDDALPVGDAEYFLAFAENNPFLPSDYIKRRLGSMTKLERARYLEGQWVHVSGNSFFDSDALVHHTELAREFEPLLPNAEPA